MPPNNYRKQSESILLAFLKKALNYENKEMLLLSNKWSEVSKYLEGLINELSQKEILSIDQLFKLDLYKQFLIESNQQVNQFNQYALKTVINGQEKFASLGIEATQKSIDLVTINFNHINLDAVKNMIGLSSDGSPLFELFNKSYPESVSKLTSTLINATALGYNPEKTARLLAANMDGNLTRALTIARTEQMNLLRTTSIMQMEESGVCKGWIRLEMTDACEDCQDENGTHHSFDESFESHPNCRGSAQPDI